MAAVTSCAPCVFGAVSTSLLSFPIDIGTVQVSVVPVITVAGNGSVSTFFTTSTILPASTPAAGGVTPTTTITFTDTSQLTWTTLDTVLTYPTTYVDYLAFQGAGATASGSCAQTLAPSSLTLPANAPPASLVYPLDRSNALPSGLISYLDGAGLPAQLAGNQLETCAALPGALPASAAISSVTIPITSATTFTSTIPTTIPPPTTFTTTISSTFTGSATIAASQAVALSTALLFNTATGNPLLISGTLTSSLTAPIAVTLGGSTTVLGQGTTSAVDITNVLSSISSSMSGAFSNVTSSPTTARSPPSASAPSTTRAVYTGLAAESGPVISGSLAGLLAGLAAVLYL